MVFDHIESNRYEFPLAEWASDPMRFTLITPMPLVVQVVTFWLAGWYCRSWVSCLGKNVDSVTLPASCIKIPLLCDLTDRNEASFQPNFSTFCDQVCFVFRSRTSYGGQRKRVALTWIVLETSGNFLTNNLCGNISYLALNFLMCFAWLSEAALCRHTGCLPSKSLFCNLHVLNGIIK